MTISYTQQFLLMGIIEYSRNLKERLDVWFVACEEEDLSSTTGNFTLENV